MDVGRLTSTGALIAAIRGEVSRKPAGKVTDASAFRSTGAKDIVALKRQLVEIVGAVPDGDASAAKQARPALIRAVLLWEFGAQFREHAEWRPIMDRVTRHFDTVDPSGQAALKLIGELKPQRR